MMNFFNYKDILILNLERVEYIYLGKDHFDFQVGVWLPVFIYSNLMCQYLQKQNRSHLSKETKGDVQETA